LSSFEFVPSPPTKGTFSFATTNGVIGGGGGEYTITRTDTGEDRDRIELKQHATIKGAGTLPGSGTMHIDLVSLDKECKP